MISDSHRQVELRDGEVARELVSARDISGALFAPMRKRETLVSRDMYGEMPLGCYVIPRMTVVPTRRGDFGYICRGQEPIIEQNADFLRKGKFLRARFTEMVSDNTDPMAVGDLVALTSRCHNNFWHWMMDCLPKVFVAESSGFRGEYLIPPANVAPWASESLALVGIPERRWICLSGRSLSAERLHLPTYFCGYNAHLNRDFARAYRLWLMERLALDSQQRGRRVFVGRSDAAPVRRVLNQTELATALKAEGFEHVHFERYSLCEQIRIASESSVLVGGHGSGLTHLFFMPKEALVLELFPHKRQQTNDCYEALATIVPHRYRALESHEMREGDIEVDSEAVRRIVREEVVI
jgi:capsular polysaccharide biosynthesis protein